MADRHESPFQAHTGGIGTIEPVRTTQLMNISIYEPFNL